MKSATSMLSTVVARSCRVARAPQALRAGVRAFAFRADARASAGAVVKAGKVSKDATDLASVLGREIEFEKEDPTTEAKLAELTAALGDFTVTDTKGSSRFFLTRQIGNQEIRVDVDCSPELTGEEEEEDGAGEDEEGGDGEDAEGNGPTEGYRLLVALKNGGQVVHIGAFVTDYLRINRVTLYPEAAAPTPDQVFGGVDVSPVYPGPSFDELDEALQNAWYEYLGERGVDDGLAEAVVNYASAKEQLEYVRWLDATRAFVQKK